MLVSAKCSKKLKPGNTKSFRIFEQGAGLEMTPAHEGMQDDTFSLDQSTFPEHAQSPGCVAPGLLHASFPEERKMEEEGHIQRAVNHMVCRKTKCVTGEEEWEGRR